MGNFGSFEFEPMSLLSELDSRNTTALVLSLISGLSTGIGGLIVILFSSPSQNAVGWQLGIASGVMLYVSFVDLLPESASIVGIYPAIFYFLIGMAFFHVLISLIPEPDWSTLAGDKKYDRKLMMTSFTVFLGICLHNFPEGMAVYLSSLKGWKLGVTIALAIGMHNIPEGIVVGASIYAATGDKWITLKWTFISGFCEPLGAIAFGLFFYNYLTERAVYCLLASVAGIMTYICVSELIPGGYRYINLAAITAANLCGILLIFLYLKFVISH